MTVKQIGFGEKLPSTFNTPFAFKQKGDKVQFKIAQPPVYTAKHFAQTEEGWDVTECARLMSEEDCDLCSKFFELKAQAKKLKAADPTLTNDSPKLKEIDNEIRLNGYNPALQFFFPVVDRLDGKMKVLQVTAGVKNKFQAAAEAGTDIMNTEWVLINTGGIGVNKYALTPVDSSKVSPLTPEEEAEFEKARNYDLSQVGGRSNSEDKEDEDFNKFAASHQS